jgi:hypothetical protein
LKATGGDMFPFYGFAANTAWLARADRHRHPCPGAGAHPRRRWPTPPAPPIRHPTACRPPRCRVGSQAPKARRRISSSHRSSPCRTATGPPPPRPSCGAIRDPLGPMGIRVYRPTIALACPRGS